MKQIGCAGVVVAALSAGCVPAGYTMRTMPGGYGGHGSMYGPTAGFGAAPSPIARWDNVMMLAVGTQVDVLMMDGGRAAGPVVAASRSSLRLRSAVGEVDLEAADVMRVDRVDGSGPRSAVREGAKGAAVGAGAVAVLGLLVGHVPPPRTFLAGGIIGAYEQTQLARNIGGSATIYVAAAVVPGARSAPQAAPRDVPR